MRWASAITTCMSCSTMRIVRSFAMRRTSSMVSWVSAALMPAVGSSRQTSSGSVASAMPISRFRCSPCERLAANRGHRAFPDGGGREGHSNGLIGRHLGCDELAVRREDRLFLRDHLKDTELAILDVEDKLADERLVVLLTQHLVALREVVTFLHLEPFERLDELHRVLATAESGP